MKNFLSLSLLMFPLLWLSLASAAPSVVCPQEKDEIAKVSNDLAELMQTYKNHLNTADAIVELAYRKDEASRKNIPEAIEELQKTVNCAAYVMRWDPLESTCRHASLSIL